MNIRTCLILALPLMGCFTINNENSAGSGGAGGVGGSGGAGGSADFPFDPCNPDTLTCSTEQACDKPGSCCKLNGDTCVSWCVTCCVGGGFGHGGAPAFRCSQPPSSAAPLRGRR